MKEKTSALYSKYVIDGVAMPLAPAEILEGCTHGRAGQGSSANAFKTIVDETTDPSPSADTFEAGRIQEYLDHTEALIGSARNIPMAFAGEYSKGRIANAILGAIWLKGSYRLGDLELDVRWKWNSKVLGNMAGFYSSVEATADYIDGLGISLSGYSFSESDKNSSVTFKVSAVNRGSDNDDPTDDEELRLSDLAPFGSDNPTIRRSRAIPDKLVADPDSWIVFIPFDTCDFRLGGSLLCEACGPNGDPFPEIGDADYFIDCHEVVREFVEDKIPLSGVTVGEGGLMTAVKSMCRNGMGAVLDMSGMMNAYGENRCIRMLFAEVPGVIIQIRNNDFDYVDAELLLQDIAYYPLGHPVPGGGDVQVKTGGGDISGILQSLLSSGALEGED